MSSGCKNMPIACALCVIPMNDYHLTKHKRTQTGERLYQCSHCNKAFMRYNDLTKHIRAHTV